MSSKLENQKRKILAVDDDAQSLELIKKALQWEGYQIETASSGSTALQKISEWEPHLVLLDVNMPGLNGLEILAFLRNSKEYVSTLFVSGRSCTEDVVRGLDSGADDYICKPYQPIELLSRIRCQLRIKDIRDELAHANSRLKVLIEIDDLTGLFNMRSLYQKLDYEIDRASRYGRAVSVAMLDMDFFKSVNDECDHLFGSFVLSEVGGVIRDTIRKVDFAARYGGDEFLVVLTETDFSGAKTFCDRICKAISDHVFKNENYTRKLTVSIGFSVIMPGEKTIDARTLVRHADHALYVAKEKGRNRVEHYQD